MQEKWLKWDPIQSSAKFYWLDSFSKSENNDLKIIFTEIESPTKGLSIIFKTGVKAYQHTNESCCYERFNNDDYPNDFFIQQSFFKIQNSNFLKSFMHPSLKLNEEQKLIHFCFLAYDDLIDVLAINEPEITFFNTLTE